MRTIIHRVTAAENDTYSFLSAAENNFSFVVYRVDYTSIRSSVFRHFFDVLIVIKFYNTALKFRLQAQIKKEKKQHNSICTYNL